MPGLDEEVMTRLPQAAPPYTILIAAVSLSACRTTIPVVSQGLISVSVSNISDCGVMG